MKESTATGLAILGVVGIPMVLSLLDSSPYRPGSPSDEAYGSENEAFERQYRDRVWRGAPPFPPGYGGGRGEPYTQGNPSDEAYGSENEAFEKRHRKKPPAKAWFIAVNGKMIPCATPLACKMAREMYGSPYTQGNPSDEAYGSENEAFERQYRSRPGPIPDYLRRPSSGSGVPNWENYGIPDYMRNRGGYPGRPGDYPPYDYPGMGPHQDPRSPQVPYPGWFAPVPGQPQGGYSSEPPGGYTHPGGATMPTSYGYDDYSGGYDDYGYALSPRAQTAVVFHPQYGWVRIRR